MTGISVDGRHTDIDEDLGFDRVTLTPQRLALVIHFAKATAEAARTNPQMGFAPEQIDAFEDTFEMLKAVMRVNPESPQIDYYDYVSLRAFCRLAEKNKVETDDATFNALTAFYVHVRQEERKYDQADAASLEVAPRPAA